MAKAKKGGKSAVQVVLASRIKDIARSANIRVAGDFVAAANSTVVGVISGAIARAKSNGRQTLRPQDL